MQNRELSWLTFNERVLDQGADETVPLLERLNFISIFWSNLQEFFMVRVGSLTDLSLLKKQVLDSKTGMTPAELSRQVRAFVVTRGAEGCELWEDGVCARVPGVTAREVRDPTGCGDAWRGALLYGLEQGWPLARCAVLGNRLGAIKVAASGPQNYTVDRQALLEG